MEICELLFFLTPCFFISDSLYVTLHFFHVYSYKYLEKRDCLWFFELSAQLNTNILHDYDDYQPGIIDTPSLISGKFFWAELSVKGYTSNTVTKYKKASIWVTILALRKLCFKL